MKTRIFLFLTLGALLAGCRNNATEPKRVRLNVEMSVSAGNRAALLENLLLLAEASRAEPGFSTPPSRRGPSVPKIHADPAVPKI